MMSRAHTNAELVLAYYGDDFTGSTDVLESLATSGIETILFLEPPTDEMLRRFPNARAIGVAGNGRTMSPSQMDTSLPRVFETLRARRPRVFHYKVCSTFDSSPEIGNIGRAIDIGERVFQNRCVPMLVAAPALQRYCVFGNLFATSGLDSDVYRLDRHPAMNQHPVTPMTEADLRLHLMHQTDRPVALVDVLTLEQGYEATAARVASLMGEKGSVVLFDALTDSHLATIGRLIGELQDEEHKPLFVVGSSGVDDALTRYWLSQDVAAHRMATSTLPSIEPVEHTLVVSGSCSPVTARQIGWAVEQGFQEFPVDAAALCQSHQSESDHVAFAQQVISKLQSRQSVIVHTSRGPSDPRVTAVQKAVGASKAAAEVLGTWLGRMLREVVRSRAVRRVVVAGGDTSGVVARSLGIDALEFAGPLEPGAPLCVARSRDGDIDALEIVFKGGQVGYDRFFDTVLRGRPCHSVTGAS